MALVTITPTLPWTKVSSDATVQTVNSDTNQTNVGMIYLHVAVDSANRIFIRLPLYFTNQQPVYKWVAIDNSMLNYPVGTIDDINCSFTYSGLNTILHIIVLANNILYQYSAINAQPGTGTSSYGWDIITPTGDIPLFTNKF